MAMQVVFHTAFRSIGGLLLITINKGVIEAAERADGDAIISYILYFVVLSVLLYLSVWLLESGYDLLKWRADAFLYKYFLRKTVYLDNNSFETIGTGYFNSVLQRGINAWSWLLSTLLNDGISGIFEIILAFILIYQSAQRRGVGVAFIALCISVAFMIRWTTISIPRRRKKRKEFSLQDKHIVRIIMSKFEVLQNNQIDFENRKLQASFDAVGAYHRNDRTWIIVAYTIPRFFTEVLRGLVYFFVGFGIIKGTYSIGDYVVLIAVVELFRRAVISIVMVYRQCIKEFIYIERLRNKFDLIEPIKGLQMWKDFVFKNGTIEIQDLSYAYSTVASIDSIEGDAKVDEVSTTKVFEDFSLALEGWKKTAFVWMSGSGKSTLIKLIAWYLTPDSGSIVIDGQPLEAISLMSYYRHVGYLTQEPSIFDGTVRENLLYAVGDAVSEETLNKALLLAKCDFVFELSRGIDTEIGERGIRLSWGQRQRLAIAKIFLKDPQILILDEPTSALDSFSEEAITQAMHTLFEGRTVLIIAHRLQTVKEADEIIVLEQGSVIERGTHTELVKKGWSYAQMLELQSGF